MYIIFKYIYISFINENVLIITYDYKVDKVWKFKFFGEDFQNRLRRIIKLKKIGDVLDKIKAELIKQCRY